MVLYKSQCSVCGVGFEFVLCGFKERKGNCFCISVVHVGSHVFQKISLFLAFFLFLSFFAYQYLTWLMSHGCEISLQFLLKSFALDPKYILFSDTHLTRIYPRGVHYTQPPAKPTRNQAKHRPNQCMEWSVAGGLLQNQQERVEQQAFPLKPDINRPDKPSIKISQNSYQRPPSLLRILPKITLLSKILPRFGENTTIFCKIW